jgi:hypothetical protein
MQFFRNIKNDMYKIFTGYGFYICVVFTVILCFSANVYTDEIKNNRYSAFAALRNFDKNFMLTDTQFCSFQVMLKGGSGWLSMFIHIQSFGLFAAVFIVAAGVITCSLKSDTMWAFPMANTIVWLHFDEILSKQIFPIWYSYTYFGVALTVLLIMDILATKKLQLFNIETVE